MIRQSIDIKRKNDDVRHLYETAFPEEEQIEWDDLIRLTSELPLEFSIYREEDGTLLGFTIMLERKPISWFWYFAVGEYKRGSGIGQSILDDLAQRYAGATYFMDIESPEQEDAPNTEQRRRRTNFYMRNGFRRVDITRSYGGIDYAYLVKGEQPLTQEYMEELRKELWKHWEPTD